MVGVSMQIVSVKGKNNETQPSIGVCFTFVAACIIVCELAN